MRIDAIFSKLKASSYKHLNRVVSEALTKWTRSGNDPAALRGARATWKTPGGDTELEFVGAVADR